MTPKKLISLFLILLFSAIRVFAQEEILSKSIKLEKKNYQLTELIDYLETNFEVKFAYDSDIFKENKIINFSNETVKLEMLLEYICRCCKLNYKIFQGQILLYVKSKNDNATLNGYIIDSVTGEYLPAATIYIEEVKRGTISNNYGFFSICLPQGIYNIVFTFIGYNAISKEFVISEDRSVTIKLQPTRTEIEEITVTKDKNPTKTDRIEVGMERLSMEEISAIPAFLGEVDVLKGFQFLPGVQSVNDGISHINVRGGTFDQNLILLDEAPVYNPTHALGFFSVFNPDAVTQAELYKAYIPAQYGGRLSSVMDVRMKEGNRNKFSLSGNINLYASRLTLETPLFNNKTSLLFSGRYSYTSMVANLGSELSHIIYMPDFNYYSSSTKINFWDFNLKLNHRLNQKNHFYLSAYSGSDYFFYPPMNNKSSIEWGNSTGTFRWNHIHNSKMFSNTSLIYSNYKYQYLFFDNGYSYQWTGGMSEGDIKSDFDWFFNPTNKFKFGFNLNSHFYQPGKIEPTDSISSISGYSLQEKIAIEPSIYLSHEFNHNKFRIQSGLRLNLFVTDYERNNNQTGRTYINLAPRLAILYKLSQNQSLKFSYSRTYQYLHLLNNASIGFPTDIWLPSDSHIKPQSADQVSLSYFTDFFNKQYEFSIETYYKRMYDIIDFVDNADLFLKEDIESEIRSGYGTSYGLELLFSKKKGKLKGNIAYTLSKSEKTINEINNNEAYPFRQDNRHIFDVNLSYELGKMWIVKSSFTYKSGAATTIVTGYYFWENIPFSIYSERNAYRLPAYHKMDIALTKKSKEKAGRNWSSELSLGVNNIYNRKNTFAVYMHIGGYYSGTDSIAQLTFFGVMPFISYSFKF